MVNRITDQEFKRVLDGDFKQGTRLTKNQKENCQYRLETDLGREDLDTISLLELNTIGKRDWDISHYIDCEFLEGVE